jgi:hypothetical protein
MATIFDIQKKGSSTWGIPRFDESCWDNIPGHLLDENEGR